MKYIKAVLIPVIALAALTSPALAQTDVTPVVNQLIDWLSVALMAASGFAVAALVRWLAAKTRMQDNEFEALLQDSAQHAYNADNNVSQPGVSVPAYSLADDGK